MRWGKKVLDMIIVNIKSVFQSIYVGVTQIHEKAIIHNDLHAI